MSKHFYKDIKLIRFCKKCGVEYRPPRFSFFASLRLCWVCRRPYYEKWYKERFLPYWNRQTPERKKEIKAQKHVVWLKWVEVNKEKRRAQALLSYHKNKTKHKGRRHRKTAL